MARPIKEGLQYFPLDVDIDQDDKMSVIEALHGIEGFGVVVRLLMKIYKEGYFYNWGKREQLIFAKRVNVDINSVKDIVSDCLEEGFFDKGKFDKFGILTSKGIQKRYLDAITRRKEVYFEERYLLINPQKYIGNNAKIKVFYLDENGNKPAFDGVNVDNNPNLDGVNDNISTQSKEEYSKEEYRRVDDIAKKQKPKSKKEEEPKSIIADELNPIKFYQENGFGAITPHVGNKVFLWADDLSNELIIHAMKIAIENNAIKWAYVEAILKDWFNKKIKTVEEVQALEVKRFKQGGKITKDEKIPQYIQDQMEKRKSGQAVEDDVLSEEAEEEKRRLLEKLGVTGNEPS